MLSECEQIFLDRVYQRHAQSLYRYSLSLLRSIPDAPSLAEECVQETFEVALRKIRVFQQLESPEAWLIATCKRITISKRRKMLNRQRIVGKIISIEDSYDIADTHNRLDEWIEKHDLQHIKQQLIQSLTEQELAVFHVYYEEELSLKESAAKLQLSENAVQGAVQRIRSKAAKISITFFTFLWFVFRV